MIRLGVRYAWFGCVMSKTTGPAQPSLAKGLAIQVSSEVVEWKVECIYQQISRCDVLQYNYFFGPPLVFVEPIIIHNVLEIGGYEEYKRL